MQLARLAKSFAAIVLVAIPALSVPARAEEEQGAQAQAQPEAEAAKKKEQENNRMKTLEGSRSNWSFQLQLTYSGSSINHPFSSEVDNPGNLPVPPIAQLSGTISARYRVDKYTTAGLGTGITTETPFQGPSNTSVSDPYVDVARSFKVGPIRNRADFLLELYTSHQEYDVYGYLLGYTLLDEAYYTFPFGLLTGIALQFDYNFFRSGNQFPTKGQTLYDFYTSPYFEYSLSKRVNLRSVIGIGSLHNNNMPGTWSLFHPKIYQTFGAGISVCESVFLYPYLKIASYDDVSTRTVFFGFNAIINIGVL